MSAQIEYLDTARPLRWHEAFAEYVPVRHRTLARRHMRRLPVALLALLFSTMTLMLYPATAFVDEALYVTVGREYLSHWFGDGARPSRAGVISGVPFVYPVLAALVDSVGGLWLIRAVSGVLLVITLVLISSITNRLFNYRAGVLATASMALAGPVIFLGQHATHDALCLTLLVGAVWLGVNRGGWRSAVAMGALLTAAMSVKYTGMTFVPGVLALTLFASPGNRVRRTALAGATTVALTTLGLLTAPNDVVHGIMTTTLSREDGLFGIIAPASESYLLLLLREHLGLLIVVSAFGAFVAMLQSWRMAGIVALLAGMAAILPTSHMMLGELSSYEKHLGWAAVFLAPLAGAGLERISRTRLLFAPVVVILAALALNAEVRSERMVYWSDVSPVIKVIKEDPIPGTYLAVGATVLDYHTSDDGFRIDWLETYDFWDTGPKGRARIVRAVETEEFPRVIVRGDDTGNPAQNAAQRVLVNALRASSSYDLEVTDNGWRIFTRVGGSDR